MVVKKRLCREWVVTHGKIAYAFTVRPLHAQWRTHAKDNGREQQQESAGRAGKRASEIAKWSRWEEREEIRLIEQKVVKCM